MSGIIRRISDSKYPRIYDEFKINLSGDSESIELVIQDLTEEHYDDAAEVIMQNHGLVSVSYRASGILSTDDDFRETKARYRRAFEEEISLICVVKGTRRIVGVNGLCMKTPAILQQLKVKYLVFYCANKIN